MVILANFKIIFKNSYTYNLYNNNRNKENITIEIKLS